jgi:hypothetical protein
MRDTVKELVALGRFPSEDDATEEQIAAIEKHFGGISQPLSKEEGITLSSCFGEEDLFGLVANFMLVCENVLLGLIKPINQRREHPFVFGYN